MKKDLEIYIHIPFCAKKCDYCDFFSVVASDAEKALYVEALLMEISTTEINEDYEICSVFFGGGTPSILDEKWIGEILDTLKWRFNVIEEAEITIECNPGTVDREKLEAYKNFGINRLSFGLQSAHDAELLSLGRIHTYEEFLKSYQVAREVGFENINVDLMSGLPNQSAVSWYKSLQTIGELNPEHISAYSLIVEEGTPLAKRKLNLPDEKVEREMYEKTQEILTKLGYHQYEISNYAKEGFECKHNIGYWKRREYLGFGVAAASFFNNIRYSNTQDLEEYLKNSDNAIKIHCDIEFLDEKTGREEFIFLGLRMIQGVNSADFRNEFDMPLRTLYGDKIDKLVEQGLLEFDEHNLKLTRQGISISNYVFTELLI